MESANSKTFRTRDMVLASTLLYYGHNILEIDRSQTPIVYFVFEETRDLAETVDAFWRKKTNVEPIAFSNEMKTLRNRYKN